MIGPPPPPPQSHLSNFQSTGWIWLIRTSVSKWKNLEASRNLHKLWRNLRFLLIQNYLIFKLKFTAKIQRILKMHKENYATLYKPHRNSQAKLNKAIFHSVEIFGTHTHTHTHLSAVILMYSWTIANCALILPIPYKSNSKTHSVPP